MPQFAANLTMMYNEHGFLERFAAAARDGFRAVEFLFPYEHPAAAIEGQLREHELQQALFNAPPGDWQAGERGITALPGREAEFRAGFERALEYARALACPRIHCMAGLAPRDADRTRMRATYAANLRWAAEKAAQDGVDVLIEPIAERNIPGYFLQFQVEAHALAHEIGAPNLKILMDLFHCQVQEGDLTVKLRQYLGDARTTRVGHVQIAGVPERNEPDTGEVRYERLFEVLDELGYTGWVGCEYKPRAGASEGLGWFHKWRNAGA
jgi:2-dehydrotetronate isomerase